MLFSWRLWLGVGSFLCLVIGTVVVPVVPLLLFWAILCSTGGDSLHSSESIKIKKRYVFLFLLPRSRLAGPCFRSVGLFSSWLEWWLPLVEASGWVSRSRSCLLRPVGSPRFKSLGCRATWSLELLPPSRSGCVQLPLPLLFITPFASLVFPRENLGFVGVDSVLAPDSEQAITFGSFSLLGIALRPRLLLVK